MKKRCSLLLTICLSGGAVFPLSAQETPDRYAVGEARAMRVSRDTEALQDTRQTRDTTQLQEAWETPRNREREQDSTKIRLAGNRLIIENLPEDGLLEIYNIMGVKVYNRRVKAGYSQYILSLPKGYYIIRTGRVTRKIALK